jgi:hypothetical protein
VNHAKELEAKVIGGGADEPADDEGHVGTGRQRAEHLVERFKRACRSANRGKGKSGLSGASRRLDSTLALKPGGGLARESGGLPGFRRLPAIPPV